MLCECGCGKETRIATKTNTHRGAVKGQPCRFVSGHTGQKKKEIVPCPPRLCECGCGQETKIIQHNDKRFGLVQGQPYRFIKWHKSKRVLTERFWSHVSIGLPDECWEWQASKKHGYGKTAIDNHSVSAHRLAYELTHGAIPNGLLICHKCNNPPCCNPKHLYAGTYADNLQDSIKAGTAYCLPPMYGQQNHKTKLTDESVRLIRNLYTNNNVPRKQLARQFGVSVSNIDAIVTHKTHTRVL